MSDTKRLTCDEYGVSEHLWIDVTRDYETADNERVEYCPLCHTVRKVHKYDNATVVMDYVNDSHSQ